MEALEDDRVLGQEAELWEKVAAAVGRGVVLETDGDEAGGRESKAEQTTVVAGAQGDTR